MAVQPSHDGHRPLIVDIVVANEAQRRFIRMKDWRLWHDLRWARHHHDRIWLILLADENVEAWRRPHVERARCVGLLAHVVEAYVHPTVRIQPPRAVPLRRSAVRCEAHLVHGAELD